MDYFGARYYLAALGRWGSVDPLGEKHPEWSPYNYVLGNPMVLVDPDGRQESANGNSRWHPEKEWSGSDWAKLVRLMAHVAPDINKEVATFLPKNLANAVGGLAVGKVVGVAATRVAMAARAGSAAEGVGVLAKLPAVRISATAIETPSGAAIQEATAGAQALRTDVARGAQIFRGGMLGRSFAAEGQFWAPENPLNPGFAERYGAATLQNG